MKRKLLVVFMGITIFTLVSCSNVGVDNVGIEEVEDLFDGGNGYLLIYIDDDNKYLSHLKETAKEKNKRVLSYNPYKKDGKNENDKPTYPDEDVEGNVLYYIEDGEIKSEVDVNVHQGLDLKNELDYLFSE